MKAVEFKGQTKVFTKPSGMTDAECGSLAVNFNGEQSVSCWELDENDIKNILKHKRVWLGVLGGGHPPVFLTTDEPVQVSIEKAKVEKLFKSKDSIYSYMQGMLEDKTGYSANEITVRSIFYDDLEVDSLDMVEIIMEIEKEYNIAIPDDKASKIKTVGNAVDYLVEILN